MSQLYTPLADNIFFAYDVGGGIVLNNTTGASITWDTEVRKNSAYTHSADSDDITIVETGDYHVIVDLAATTSTTTRGEVNWVVQEDPLGVGSFAAIPGAVAGSYHRTATTGDVDSATISFVRTFTATDIIRARGTSSQASAITSLANACRIYIRKLN